MKEHGMGGRVGRIVGMTVLGVLGAVFLGLVLGYLVEYLWNWLMPSIFGVSKIGYWQAFGLIILAKLLFGGMGGHPHPDHHDHKHPFHEDRPEKDDDTRKCGWHQWTYYDEWWRKEGKASFDAYIEREKENVEED
jgi:hypothetical protein